MQLPTTIVANKRTKIEKEPLTNECYSVNNLSKALATIKGTHLGIYNIVQLDAELKIQGLQNRTNNSIKAMEAFTTICYMLGCR